MFIYFPKLQNEFIQTGNDFLCCLKERVSTFIINNNNKKNKVFTSRKLVLSAGWLSASAWYLNLLLIIIHCIINDRNYLRFSKLL